MIAQKSKKVKMSKKKMSVYNSQKRKRQLPSMIVTSSRQSIFSLDATIDVKYCTMTIITTATESHKGSRRMIEKERKRRKSARANLPTVLLDLPQPKSVSYLVTPPEERTSGFFEKYGDFLCQN